MAKVYANVEVVFVRMFVNMKRSMDVKMDV